MAESSIVVRRPEFEWPDEVPLDVAPGDPVRTCDLLALSFTLPYLEPYLIRTMRVASGLVDDEGLKADMKAFSGQEAQHYRNHARINDLVRAQLSESGASAMRALEDGIEADYRRFTDTKSIEFNLAYAEGFEAMTFALARSSFSDPSSLDVDPGWGTLFGWHLAEEVEHRTVTFDAYEHVAGSYLYRTIVGTRAQAHFLGFLLRMATVLRREVDDPGISAARVRWDSAKRNWRSGAIPGTLRALSPRYNPRKVELSEEVRATAALVGVEL